MVISTKSMRIAAAVLAFCPLLVFASGGGGHPPFWEQPVINIENKQSLQRGAQLYVNYCMGCHAAKYHRWAHVAEDLGIPPDLLQNNLIWTTGKKGKKDRVGSLMTNAMTKAYGKQVFGKAPPDLTLAARYRTPAWIYNYLQSFYLDPSSPTGVNNAVLENAAMPHVLWPLQGWQVPVYASEVDGHGEHAAQGAAGSGGGDRIVGFKLVAEGRMSPEEFDRALNDLVNFMVYLAEPARLDRTAIGGWVIAFLLILLLVTWLLKREYWKDVHPQPSSDDHDERAPGQGTQGGVAHDHG